jgi:hypothetical protein
MLVTVVILFLVVIGVIVAYYMGYLDKYINPEEPPPPLTPPAVITPSPAPTVSPATAAAPTAAAPPVSTGGAFPSDIQGLSGRYTAQSFNDQGNSWADLSPMQNHIVDVKGNLKKTEDYVYGSTSVGLKFPIEVFGLDNAYTMFYVARYNGSTKKRIFDGTNNNWFSGFWGGRTGVAHHKGWLTQSSSAVHGPHAWVIATDAPNKYRTYGEDRVTDQSVYNSTSQITVNMGANYDGESSDWAIKEVIFYNRLLNLSEIERVESYLIKTYKSELPEEVYGAKGFVGGGKFVEDPRPVPYGYGTPEFCRQQAISLGYPIWGHRNDKHTNQNARNKCFYYLGGAFEEFEENDEDEVHTIGCADPQRDVFTGCPE